MVECGADNLVAMTMGGKFVVFTSESPFKPVLEGAAGIKEADDYSSIASNLNGSLVLISDLKAAKVHCFSGKLQKQRLSEFRLSFYPSKLVWLDLNCFLVALKNGTMEVFRRKGTKIKSFEALHLGNIWEVVQFRDKWDLICCGQKGTISRIDVKKGSTKWRQQFEREWFAAAALSPDEETAVIGGYTKKIYFISALNGERLKRFGDHFEFAWPVLDLSWSKNKKFLCVLTWKEVIMMRIEENQKEESEEGYEPIEITVVGKRHVEKFRTEFLATMKVLWNKNAILVGDSKGKMFFLEIY